MVLDPVMLLLGGLVVLLIAIVLGVVFATRAQRRREQVGKGRPITPESPQDIARWVEEGRELFHLWQERIERLDELQSRLAAMAQEIGQLRAQVGRIDELQAEITRLGQETEALRAERDQLRSVLARIAELVQRAGGGPPGEAR